MKTIPVTITYKDEEPIETHLTPADTAYHMLKKPGCRVVHPSATPGITITKTGEPS